MLQIFVFMIVTLTSLVSYSEPIPLPDVLGELQVANRHDYETADPGYGHVTHYQTTNTTASIYIYNRQLLVIPESIHDQLYANELSIALTELNYVADQLGYEDVDIQISGKEGRVGRFPCLSMVFSYVQEGVPRVSMTCVFGFENQIVKVRYTFVPISDSGQRERLRSFMEATSIYLESRQWEVKKGDA